MHAVSATSEKSETAGAGLSNQTGAAARSDRSRAARHHPGNDEDLEALAAARAKSGGGLPVAGGKVEAGRLFLKSSQAENLRKDGSRTYLQFQ